MVKRLTWKYNNNEEKRIAHELSKVNADIIRMKRRIILLEAYREDLTKMLKGKFSTTEDVPLKYAGREKEWKDRKKNSWSSTQKS